MADKYLIRYLPIAVEDVLSIYDWIAADSPASAAAFRDKLDQRITSLMTHPYLGRIHLFDRL